MTLVKECVQTEQYRTFDGECEAHLHISFQATRNRTFCSSLPNDQSKDLIYESYRIVFFSPGFLEFLIASARKTIT